MGIVLDIIILAILILSIIMGYRKGLIGVVFSLCAFIIAIIITWILYNPITNLVINNTEIDDNIKNTIIENGVIEIDKDKEENEENVINAYIQKYITGTIAETSNDIVEQSAGIVAEKVVAIGVAIVLFIVVRIALILVKFIVEGIANLPIIKQFNKVGGTAYGVLRGLLIIYFILAVMFFIISVNNTGTLANAINTSIVSKVLYSNNIILNIIF